MAEMLSERRPNPALSSHGSARPGRRSSQRLILDSAHQCFRRFGYEKTTIADIARGAGLTRRTVYQYYTHKKAIWDATLQDAAGKISDALCDLMRGNKPIVDRLTEVVLRAAEMFDSHGLSADRPRLLFRRDDSLSEHSRFNAIVRTHVAEELMRQKLLASDIRLFDLVAWLTLSGSAIRVAKGLDGIRAEELRQIVFDLVVAPLLPAPRNIQPISEAISLGVALPRPNPGRSDLFAAPSVRQRIIEAALLRFSRENGQDSSIADVASEADVDRRTIYRHFADRRALMEEVALLEARRINAQMRRLLVRRSDPADIVADGISLSIHVFAQSPLKEQLIAGTEVISTASDRNGRIFQFIRLQWQQILTRLAQNRSTNASINLDIMATWLLLMQHVLHRSLDITGSEDIAVRRFIRRFVVDPFVTEPYRQ